ncbi:multiubiquitin domain-containing protein [Fodinibius sediminis]|uniref:Multiubiquitin n=1 Tax=Fodinibius sediminis TaxID=1214077 RepID=A0A521ECK0_9BACT|nr:multiubiquitin domain-containing protein [Fodinibius sediminis]SMO81647.1 Multiubiquitin [Fodinibius sediminis]
MSKDKFQFKIENEPHKWDKQYITGKEVREIPPGIPDNMDLFLKRRGEPGELIEDDDKIDLDDPGIEKFYSQVADSTPGS